MKADPQQTHITHQWAHTSPLIACRFDPTGNYVFASTEDYAVQRWRLSDGQKVSYPAAHESWVGALAFLPDGRTLITGGFEGCIKWWPATDAKPAPTRSISAHAGWVRALAVSPDGKWLASGGNDHLVKIWNAADGTLVRELSGHRSHVYSTLFHPSGAWVLSGDLQGEIRQWDVRTGRTVRTFDGKALHTYEASQQVHYGGIRSLTLTTDGKHLAAGGLYNATNPLGAVNDPLVLLFQWTDQKKVRSHVIGGVQGIIWRVVGASCWIPDRRLRRRQRRLRRVLEERRGQGVLQAAHAQRRPRSRSASGRNPPGDRKRRSPDAHPADGAGLTDSGVHLQDGLDRGPARHVHQVIDRTLRLLDEIEHPQKHLR